MLAVGQSSITKPPFAPQPVTAAASAVGVKLNVLVVATPVMVSVCAEASQVFAARRVVVGVIVPLESPFPQPYKQTLW